MPTVPTHCAAASQDEDCLEMPKMDNSKREGGDIIGRKYLLDIALTNSSSKIICILLILILHPYLFLLRGTTNWLSNKYLTYSSHDRRDVKLCFASRL